MTGHEYRHPRLGAAIQGQRRLHYARCSCGWESPKGAVRSNLTWRAHVGGVARANDRRKDRERQEAQDLGRTAQAL